MEKAFGLQIAPQEIVAHYEVDVVPAALHTFSCFEHGKDVVVLSAKTAFRVIRRSSEVHNIIAAQTSVFTDSAQHRQTTYRISVYERLLVCDRMHYFCAVYMLLLIRHGCVEFVPVSLGCKADSMCELQQLYEFGRIEPALRGEVACDEVRHYLFVTEQPVSAESHVLGHI